MVKEVYSFTFPAGKTKEDIQRRAEQLNTKPARLMDMAIGIVLDTSFDFLEYITDLSKRTRWEPYKIIERLIMDGEARRGVEMRIDTSTKIKDLIINPTTFTTPVKDDNTELSGNELFKFMLDSYEAKRDHRIELNTKLKNIEYENFLLNRPIELLTETEKRQVQTIRDYRKLEEERDKIAAERLELEREANSLSAKGSIQEAQEVFNKLTTWNWRDKPE